MPTNYPVPKAEAIAEILSGLLGCAVTVKSLPTPAASADSPTASPDGTHGLRPLTDDAAVAVVSDYRADSGPLAAVCVTDTRLSNMLGAALTMVPATTVDDCEKKNIVDEMNLENLSEVVNIMTRLFNSGDTPQVRWIGTHQVPATVDDEIAAMLGGPVARRDFEVAVAEYGVGRLALLVA